MDLYEKCLGVLETAQTDTEKFAALLVVQRTLKFDSVPPNFRNQVFKAIGNEFFSRLLNTENVPQGCPPFVFKSLSFSLLSSLLTYNEDNEIFNIIIEEFKVITDILITKPKFDEEEKMLEDVIYCINASLMNEDTQKKLINKDICNFLIDNFLLDCCVSKKSLQLIFSLLSESPRDTWLVSGPAFYRLLDRLTQCFDMNNAEKFEISNLTTFIKIIESHPIAYSDPPWKDISMENWLIRLRKGMFNIIKSKIFRTKEYREGILNLAGRLTEKFGISWLGLHSTNGNEALKETRQFTAVLIHVSSIEICILFDDCSGHPEKAISHHAPVILSCYNIIECMITVTSEHIWEVIHEYTKQILDSVNSTMGAIMNFLNDASVFWEDLKKDKTNQSFVTASIRLLCAWMAEETSALRDEICQVLPFVFDLTRNSLNATNERDKDELIKFILPPLCHLSADNVTRRILMEQNVASLLVDYLETLWKDNDLGLTSPLPNRDDERMVTVCGVLLNLVVMEGQNISNEETFFHLFKFLCMSLPQISTKDVNLLLQANFSVLGLMIARHFCERLRTCEVSFYKFLSSSIKFLWNAYEIHHEMGRTTLVLAKEYNAQWNDLKELWFLGLQALTSLFAMVPWIGQFLLNSGWPDHVVSSLASVGINDIEISVKSAYQNFLCCLVKLCPDEFKSLQAVLEVSSKHNMKELESLLLAVDISRNQDISAIAGVCP